MSDHVEAVTHDLLVRELCKVTEWDVLGIYLGLDESEITEIERDHQSNARRRIAMLAKWMEKDVDVSWEKVIDALESLPQIRLANQLKEKYFGTSESNLPATAAGPKAPAESSPEKELMVDRQESIAQEIEEIEEKYLLLVTNVEAVMAEANPSLIKLKRFSKFYGNSTVESIEELFDLLEPLNFLDNALLEKIVKFFLSRTHQVVDDLRDYLEQLTNFKSSTTVQQFIGSIEQAQQSHSTTSERPGLCTVKLRLVGGWLTKTMDHLEKLVNEIFKDKVYVLSHLKIVRGSVIVTFSAPLSEADSLDTLAKEQSSFALKVGVSLLVVADTVITQNESSDFSFESSLLGAIQDNDLNLLRFLLNIHTSADAADDSGRTALYYGSYYNRDNVVTLLLKANANPDFQKENGATPLFIASQYAHTDIISLLLNANADPNLQMQNGATPLYSASQFGYTDVISLLLKANANPNLQKENGATPLYIASQEGHTGTISLLLKANANPDLQKENGATPLYIASQNSHTDIVTLLLKANANPNLQWDDGATPLHVTSLKGHTDIVALLLNANANPNLQCNDGTTPLYIASQNSHTDVISLLLKANANPNLHRNDGATPLMIAIIKGHTQIVPVLLANGADPNLQQSNCLTALMLACFTGHSNTVDLLLKSGADPSIKLGGLTALDVAAKRGHKDIVDLLQTMEPSQSSILTCSHS